MINRISTRKLSRKYRRNILSLPLNFTYSIRRRILHAKTGHIWEKKNDTLFDSQQKNTFTRSTLVQNRTVQTEHLDPENCNCALSSGKRNVYVHHSKINKVLSVIKYPKLAIFFIVFISTYFLFCNSNYDSFQSVFASMGYIQTYFAGFLYVFGFTAAPATALLGSLPEDLNVLLAGLIGGLGALTGDVLLFFFIRSFFTNEIRQLFEDATFKIKMLVKGITRDIKKVTQNRFIKICYPLNKKMSYSCNRYLFPIVGGLIIASPLPTELGVTMMASSKKISLKTFACIAFLLQTLAIVFLIIYSKL